MKKSLEVFTSNQVAALRLFSAFLFFIPILLLRFKEIPNLKTVFYSFISGLTGTLLPAYCYATAGAHIDSSLSGLLNSMTPIFTLLLGVAFYRQQVVRVQLMGIGLGFIGSLLLIFGTGQSGSFSINPYALLIVAATVMYGINLNFSKKYLNQVHPILLTTLMLSTMAPICGVALFGSDFLERVSLPQAQWPLIYTLILGIFGSGVATVLFYKILQITSPVVSSSVTYLIPIVAVMWGLLDGEKLYTQHFLGMATILLGVYLVNRPAKS